MAKRSQTPRKKVERKPTGGCVFCKVDRTPDYKEVSNLEKFLTDRAKIVSRARTGVCSKHQRRLAQEIKRARHLGLLPFTGGL